MLLARLWIRRSPAVYSLGRPLWFRYLHAVVPAVALGVGLELRIE